MSAVSRPPQHLALIVALAATVGVLAALLVSQAITPRVADAGTSDGPVLRSIDRSLSTIKYGDISHLHRDLSSTCRAIATDSAYRCP